MLHAMRRLLAPLLLLVAFSATAAVPELSLTPRGSTLRIAVVGDTGDGADRVAAGIAIVHKRQPLDAVILTGDNIYPCGAKSPTDPAWGRVTSLTTLGIPLFPLLGNHDYCPGGDGSAQLQATGILPNWRFPAREYALRTPLADFAMLDTTPYARGTSRAAETTIRDIFAASKVTWHIVAGHHTIVSSGYHGYRPKGERDRMRRLLPVMRGAGVELYLCGHDHHLELWDGHPRMLISGAGSDPIPPVALHARTLYPSEIRRERIGFAVLELTATKMRVTFYDEKGRTLWDSR
jgi:tartrate-resistant acid phosphatase type 5